MITFIYFNDVQFMRICNMGCEIKTIIHSKYSSPFLIGSNPKANSSYTTVDNQI